MKRTLRSLLTSVISVVSAGPLAAEGLQVGSPAPLFTLPNQAGVPFALKSTENKNWTVLYFYPKAETPGCTAQACAFRDAIAVITQKNAVVYGVSTDSVADLKAFKEHHHLSFDLLSDADGKVSESYGAKMPLVNYSKRHTFIIDPQLKIRYIDRDVDPAKDAKKIADQLTLLQGNAAMKQPPAGAPTTTQPVPVPGSAPAAPEQKK